jgi:hypothetical protein
MLLRCYLIFRLFSIFTKWRTTLADRCCDKVGIDADTVFALKSIYKEKPFFILFLSSFVSVIVFAVAIRLFER